MGVLVCPASFKGVLSARRAAEAIAEGVRDAGSEPVVAPVADGGEGTLDALLTSGGERHVARVQGPYGEDVEASWATLSEGTAVVEMAEASGVGRVRRAVRDLRVASSFGTGQLIALSLASGARRLIVGIGGSATNDGGMGAMRALGARFLDASGAPLEEAGALARLQRIDTSGVPRGEEVVVACDVDSPLLGPSGATRMFGPQKGGTPEVLDLLESGMTRYAVVLRETFGWDVAAARGAGAAGGIGAALLAFLKGRFRPGIDVVLDALGFDALAARADLLLTGEGRLDAQSLHGKAIAGVVRRAGGRPVIALCGRVDLPESAWRQAGLAGAVAIAPESPPSSAEAGELLRAAARHAVG